MNFAEALREARNAAGEAPALPRNLPFNVLQRQV
jgi:hypothetical protein